VLVRWAFYFIFFFFSFYNGPLAGRELCDGDNNNNNLEKNKTNKKTSSTLHLHHSGVLCCCSSSRRSECYMLCYYMPGTFPFFVTSRHFGVLYRVSYTIFLPSVRLLYYTSFGVHSIFQSFEPLHSLPGGSFFPLFSPFSSVFIS
jgi:hypothetical protein